MLLSANCSSKEISEQLYKTCSDLLSNQESSTSVGLFVAWIIPYFQSPLEESAHQPGLSTTDLLGLQISQNCTEMWCKNRSRLVPRRLGEALGCFGLLPAPFLHVLFVWPYQSRPEVPSTWVELLLLLGRCYLRPEGQEMGWGRQWQGRRQLCVE